MWQRRQFAVLFSPRCVPRRVALPSKRLYPKWLWQLNFSQPRQLLWVLHTRGALPLRLTLHRCLQTDCGTFAGFPLHVHPAAAPAQFNADGTAGWPGSLREAAEPDQNQQRRTNTRPSRFSQTYDWSAWQILIDVCTVWPGPQKSATICNLYNWWCLDCDLWDKPNISLFPLRGCTDTQLHFIPHQY